MKTNKSKILCTIIFCFLATLLVFIPVYHSIADIGINTNESRRLFDSWVDILKTKKLNKDFGNDSTKIKWLGVDGKPIIIGVRQPRIVLQDKSQDFNSIELSDSSYRFEEAVSRLKKNRANRLNIEKGEYHFFNLVNSKIYPPKGLAHIYLENLQDVEIDGNGATFIFHNNQPGIIIQQSQRLKIKNLILKFATNDKTVMKVVMHSGEKTLKQLPESKDIKAKDIFQVIELNEDTSFKIGGKRVVYGPEFSQPLYVEGIGFKHKSFQEFDLDTKFLALHHWYGGQAIKIDGDRDDNQTEDITVDNVTILSTPGMGITTTGLKRGLLIENCKFGLNEAEKILLDSPSWDALNIHQAGGDIIIRNNSFYAMTDDAINVYNPIQTIQSFNIAEQKIVLKTSSRFIKPDDEIAFFNSGGMFTATAKVIASKPVGGGVFEFKLNQMPRDIKINWIVRDISLFHGGFYIAENTFKNLSGHAILAQTINGLIENNKIQDLTRNAIRLLSSVGVWREGVGVFNVIVRKNIIENSGLDYDTQVPWGAITLYSITDGLKLPDYLINDTVEISSNKIINPKQNCVSVTNTSNAKVFNNECTLDGKVLSNKYIVTRSLNVTSQ